MDERLSQLALCGLIGSRKSRLISRLLRLGVEAGNGIVYVDWRGDGFDGLLRYLAATRFARSISAIAISAGRTVGSSNWPAWR